MVGNLSDLLTQQIPPRLAEALRKQNEKTLILTPNQRLSRYLHSCYDQLQLANQQLSWPRLQCMPRTGWFKQLWQQLQLNASHPQAAWQLLNNLQEQALWREISETHASPWPLLNPQQLQKFAAEAWHSLRLWRISLTELQANWSQLDEVQLLLTWIHAYEKSREKRQWLDQSALQLLLADSVKDLVLPERIYLYGFEKSEPLFLHFLEQLQTRSCVVEELAFTREQTAHAQRVIADDFENELSLAARWAAAMNASEPQARIAIVVPELAQQQDKVERIFNTVFNPQYSRPDYPRHAPAFNMSAAKQLAQTPPVAAALQALQLNRFELALDDVANIFSSAFIADYNSLNARQLFISALRTRYQNIRSARLRSELATAAESQPELQNFYQQLGDFFALLRGKTSEALTAEQWLQIFQQQLQALGWPGTRTPDSLEYQQLSQWQEVLDNFISLDIHNKRLSFEEALSWFKQAALFPFHVQSQPSPIQVLGLLEAAGLHFDYLWLAQMDELRWPPAPAPNPLLPLKLQIEKNMPRASQAGELTYAQNLMQRLLHSADHVIFSHARQGQNEELQASPLVQHFPVLEKLPQAALHTEATATLEEIKNDAIAALIPGNSYGGTQILRDFAACPFKAFARYRLHAQTESEKRNGIDAITRGNLLHQSLDNLWHRLRTQAALLALDEHSERKLVEQAVEAAWKKVTAQADISSTLQTLELERTCGLLGSWLKLEKQRLPFTVRERERAHQVKVGELPLQVRYDRVDELEDGSLVVIDYKSSPYHSIAQWAGTRPDEPQVPVYALANKEKVSAAAFALVSARKTAFEGLQKHAAIAPDLKTADAHRQNDLPSSWEEVLAHWEFTLGSLAERWLQGDAAVDPKKKQQTCQRCDLHALCRIKEKLTTENSEDSDELESGGQYDD